MLGGRGRMSVLVPSSEKQRDKYGIFGSDSRKESSTPAKSLYLFNVPKLNCRKPVSVQHIPKCAVQLSGNGRLSAAGAGPVMIWKNLTRSLHFVLFSF